MASPTWKSWGNSQTTSVSARTAGHSISKPAIDWFTTIRKEHLIFEAKTAIASVGETLRQIRLYQQYQPGVYVVVSPDDRYTEVMRGQGIQFLKYEEQN